MHYVNQDYTGEQTEDDVDEYGIDLKVVKLAEAKRGFVLLPRQWVVERSFAWPAGFRRLARDYDWLALHRLRHPDMKATRPKISTPC